MFRVLSNVENCANIKKKHQNHRGNDAAEVEATNGREQSCSAKAHDVGKHDENDHLSLGHRVYRLVDSYLGRSRMPDKWIRQVLVALFHGPKF